MGFFCYYFVVVGGERGFSEVVFSELVSPMNCGVSILRRTINADKSTKIDTGVAMSLESIFSKDELLVAHKLERRGENYKNKVERDRSKI